tara:strand:- start:343 stop:795 length:453 start_codon:yes stop_codon:yes gene_type:complete
MTTYIASVTSTGEISSMWTSPAVPTPAEGENPDNSGETIVWITQSVPNCIAFMETKYYKNGDWVDRGAKPTEFHLWQNEAWTLDSSALYVKIRHLRTKKLYGCDWTQTSDSPLTDAKKAEWAEYRAALRSVPATNNEVTHLDQVVWPTAP